MMTDDTCKFCNGTGGIAVAEYDSGGQACGQYFIDCEHCNAWKNMATDDIDKLTGHELSAAVAREVMGWHIGTWFAKDDYWFSTDGKGICAEYPVAGWQPHTDRNDSHRVLMRCEELGIVPDLNTWIVRASEVTMFALLTLDPATICRAALRAVRASR